MAAICHAPPPPFAPTISHGLLGWHPELAHAAKGGRWKLFFPVASLAFALIIPPT